MTLRPDEISRQWMDDGSSRYSWHLRFKGVSGRGTYGSVITDCFGRGLYLLAEGDLPGTPGCDERMICLVSPADLQFEIDASPDYVRRRIVAVLLALGWGPLVAGENATGTT